MESSHFSEINEKDNRCAPSKKFENGSCISLKILIEMAKVYNQEFNDKIQLSTTPEILNPAKYKIYLLKQFKKRLDKVCDSQRCWIRQDFIKKLDPVLQEDLANHTFRPEGPADRNAWLDTFNINNVLFQYEKTHPNFKFLGAVPIDFNELPDLRIHNLDFEKLYLRGITKIGIVYNLDEHYKSGSHWTAGFFDLASGEVYYFDSYGIKPEKRIVALMRKAAQFIKDYRKIYPVVDFNRTRHQYGDVDCGVYSISFVTRMLKTGDFKNICQNIVKDKDINVCRTVYFT